MLVEDEKVDHMEEAYSRAGVSCVHPVAVLNAAFCVTYNLLMLVEDAIGDHTEEGTYGRSLLDGGP